MGKNAIIGKCRLCLKENITLRDSHYLPAAAYKIIRDPSSPNPNPFKIDKNTSIQTSEQVRAHLLCKDCEERFNKYGENWFFRHCWRPNGFRLRDILQSSTPFQSDNKGSAIYHAANIPAIDRDALIYFAISMLWRGAAHDWGKGWTRVNLGKYQDALRRYLDGNGTIPTDLILWVIVSSDTAKLTGFVTFPHGLYKPETVDFGSYRFALLGMYFMYLFGYNVAATHREKDFINGEGNPIIISTITDNLAGHSYKLMKLELP